MIEEGVMIEVEEEEEVMIEEEAEEEEMTEEEEEEALEEVIEMIIEIMKEMIVIGVITEKMIIMDGVQQIIEREVEVKRKIMIMNGKCELFILY